MTNDLKLMIDPINQLLTGVPDKQKPQILRAALESCWTDHRENLQIIRDKNNPIRDEAFRELLYGIRLGKAALQSDLTPQAAMPLAKMLANLNIPDAAAKQSMFESLQSGKCVEVVRC